MIQPSRRALAVILAAFAIASAAAAGAAPLPPRREQALYRQGLPPSSVSIVVRDTVTGEAYLGFNAREPRSPASTIKVLTSYAALEQLGPSDQWLTRAYVTGPVIAGRRAGTGRIRLATGRLSGVSAVAGWVISRAERPLTVIAIVNPPAAGCGRGQAVSDTIVRWALDR
jgi:D-alanyl-D-alanine carboxypeptidase